LAKSAEPSENAEVASIFARPKSEKTAEVLGKKGFAAKSENDFEVLCFEANAHS
jgi:hypothetical protein